MVNEAYVRHILMYGIAYLVKLSNTRQHGFSASNRKTRHFRVVGEQDTTRYESMLALIIFAKQHLSPDNSCTSEIRRAPLKRDGPWSRPKGISSIESALASA
jgi:hypothetical protein